MYPNFRRNCYKYLMHSQGGNKSNKIGRWAPSLCMKLSPAVSVQHNQAKTWKYSIPLIYSTVVLQKLMPLINLPRLFCT
jgi:hypothetical protein